MGNRTYIDSNVIINLFARDNKKMDLSHAILNDPDRTLIIGDYVKLETAPKMRYNMQEAQFLYTEALFEKSEYIASSKLIMLWAHAIAEFFGLAAMDALHAASAMIAHADEFITFEKPDKPFFRIPPELLRIVSLYE